MNETDEEQERLKQIIREYEITVPVINDQLQFYKSEYSSLKKEVMAITKENNNLATQMEECSNNHVEAATFTYKDNDLVENLKNQLNISIKEKESVVELWRNSLARIDDLESELKIYSAGSESVNKSLICKLKKTYDNEVKNLREQLQRSNHSLEETANLSKTSLASKKDELATLNKHLQDANAKISKLEDDLIETQKKLTEINVENVQLRDTIHKEKKNAEKIRLDSYNSKLKVAEACHVIEAALLEKDAAIIREKDAQDEVQKLTITINEIVQETETKVKAEVFKVKEEFATKLHNCKLELKKCQEELSLKTIEFEKRMELCGQLEAEIQQIKECRNQLLCKIERDEQIWGEKVDQNKEKVASHERKYKTLKEQFDEIVTTLDNAKKKHQDALCAMKMEKKHLQSQIHTLENELQLSESRCQQVTCKVNDLSRRLMLLDVQLKDELALKNAESDRILSEKLNEVQELNARIKEEFKTQLSAQISMSQKWKCEVRVITQKLETRIHVLKTELITTRNKNLDLIAKLEISESKRMEYQEKLKSICAEFNAFAKK